MNYKNWEQREIFDDIVKKANERKRGCRTCMNYYMLPSDEGMFDYCMFYRDELKEEDLKFWEKYRCVGYNDQRNYKGRPLNHKMKNLAKLINSLRKDTIK